MTHAFGGGGNLTLATLYVPVKPEIKGLHEEMVRVGEQATKSLTQGMNSSGLTQTVSAMALGLQRSMPAGLSHAFGELHSQLDHLGKGALAAQTAFDRYSNSMRLSSEAANHVHGEETKLLNLRNQATNISTQIAEKEALISERYGQHSGASRGLQKEEEKLQTLRTKGNNIATQIVVSEGQVTNAQMLHTQRVQESTTAHERYNQALQQSHSHLNLGAIGTAALTGSVTALTYAAVNLAADGLSAVVHGLEGIVRAGAGVVDSVIGVGQHFQDLNRQVTLFTTESGPALDSLQNSMRNVYANLDVPADRLGETLGVLHQQFGLTGDGLEKVSRHLTELGARFGGIDVREFSAMMHQFGVEGVEPVDKALGQLIYDSEKYGVTVQSLQNSMVQMGPIWDALDVNYNSAAMATSRIEQLGDPARRVMLGLSATAKEMAKGPDPKGTFKQYMQDVLQTGANLQASGGDALADAFAQSEFSVRNWAILKQTYGILQDAMNNAGKEGDNIDLEKLILATRTLHERFTLFFHDVEARLSPLALNIVQHIGGGLDTVQHWFDTHQTEIIAKIKEWGDIFIVNIPKIQHFVGEAVRFIGDFITFSVKSFGFVGEALGMLFGNKDMEELGRKITNFDMRPLTDKIGNEIEYGLHIDVGALKSWWDNEAIPGLVKNQPKVDVPTDLITPDGKHSLLDEKQMQDWVKDKGEKIGGALIDGVGDGAEKAWDKVKEKMPAPVRWALEFPNKAYNWVEQFNPVPSVQNFFEHGGPGEGPLPGYGILRPASPDNPGGHPSWHDLTTRDDDGPSGNPWTSGASVDPGPPHPAQTSGYTEPVNNAPTSVVLATNYKIDPHANEPAAPPGIGAPTWPGMPKSGGKGSGKDPALQAQERQDRLDNATDAKNDADDAYKDAVAAAKVAEEKDQPLIDKYKGWVAASRPGSTLREGYQKDLDAATEDLTKARHAAARALHAKDRAGRALNEAETKADEPEKGGDDANIQKLGQSLIPGLMQEMGFGDIFGKAPNEWGVFKILGGALQWGLKAANAFGAAGIKIGPHGLTMPTPGSSNVGPQEVSPFGPERGPLPGPGQNASPGPGQDGSQTWWGMTTNLGPHTTWGMTRNSGPHTTWGYTKASSLRAADFPSQIQRGTALASATSPNISSAGSQPVALAGLNTLPGQPYGLPHGTNIPYDGNPPGGAQFPPWVYQLAAQFNLKPSTYGGHQETGGAEGRIASGKVAPNPQGQNRGVDWSGSQADMDRFAAYLQQTGQAEQVIHYDPNTNTKYGYPYGVDYNADYPGHGDHVHTRFSSAPPIPRRPGDPPQGFQMGGLVGFDQGGNVSGWNKHPTRKFEDPMAPKDYNSDYADGIRGGRFNSGIKIDTSTSSIAPGYVPHQYKGKSQLLGFKGGGDVPPDPNDSGGLAPWDTKSGASSPRITPWVPPPMAWQGIPPPGGHIGAHAANPVPIVRYPEGGAHWWDNSRTSEPPPSSGSKVRYGPGSWDWFGSPKATGVLSGPGAGPGGTPGKGTGYGGAGFQPGGDWLKSNETTKIGSHYQIKSGDTLSDIASRSGLSISDIQKANPNITNPDMINAGDALTLPGAAGPQTPSRGWFNSPFSTKSPIKLPPALPIPAVTAMTTSGEQPSQPTSILGRILSPLIGWLGGADTGSRRTSAGVPRPASVDIGPQPDDGAGLLSGLDPALRWLLHGGHHQGGIVQGFQHGGVVGFNGGGAAGLYNPPLPYQHEIENWQHRKVMVPQHRAGWEDAKAQKETQSGIFNPRFYGKFLSPGNFNPNVQLDSGYDSSQGWPFQWPLGKHGLWPQPGESPRPAGPPSIAPWDTAGHAKGGVVQGFAQGGVVGFDKGGQAGDSDNFYKHWYPRSQTPTPTASTAMLRPDSLGGLLGSTDTHPSAPAATSPSAVRPWGVMAKPAPDAMHPLPGFRSLEDEHRATGFGRLSRALSTFTGVLPDVALDYDTLTHWGQHTGWEQTGAVIDTASMIPGLGTVLGEGAGAVGRGAAHGIKALQAARFSRGLPDEFRIASGRLGGAGAAAQQHPRWPQYQKYVNHNEVIGPRLGYPRQKSLSFEEWLRLQDQAELGDDAVEVATRRAAEVKPPAVSTATDLATLQSIVHKPTANSIEMREFVKPWGNANAFQTMQPGVMKGIYDALAGKPGGITPEVLHAIAQWQDNAWRWTAEEYAANTPPEMQEIFRLFGGQVAANMVHSAPTDRSIFRGVAWPHERAETLKKGQILSMKRPASFAREEEAAAEAALFRQEWQHNYEELTTLPERLLDMKEPERSILKEKIAKLAGGRRPGNSGAYIDTIGESGVYAPGWDPILWELVSGAHVADLSPSFSGWDEQVGMGRFKIADLQRQEPWGLIRGKLQQTAINPGTSGFAYGGLASTDTIPAMLTPGEVVLSKSAVDAIGLDTALGINALGLAGGGEVPVSAAPNISQDKKDWFKQQSLTGALGGISSIISGLGADLNPKQWNGLLAPPEQRQSAVHYDNSIHITGNTIADPKQQQQAQQERWNSRFETTTGGLPMPSVGAP